MRKIHYSEVKPGKSNPCMIPLINECKATSKPPSPISDMASHTVKFHEICIYLPFRSLSCSMVFTRGDPARVAGTESSWWAAPSIQCIP